MGPKESHTVPICPKDASDTPKSDVFVCDGLVCNRCRCDVKRGYRLSNDTAQAECVMFCPRIRTRGSLAACLLLKQQKGGSVILDCVLTIDFIDNYRLSMIDADFYELNKF
ncbi:unnamed protein product [Gongylonema pulchrum]|uniref:Uncharacterized protein n=1 Tax=Gongylonema pulchrum TaxID=637853 RepID=A0A3P6RWW4_9BILA|nr:unnamed protein product [Gongylonema pulchrum]